MRVAVLGAGVDARSAENLAELLRTCDALETTAPTEESPT